MQNTQNQIGHFQGFQDGVYARPFEQGVTIVPSGGRRPGGASARRNVVKHGSPSWVDGLSLKSKYFFGNEQVKPKKLLKAFHRLSDDIKVSENSSLEDALECVLAEVQSFVDEYSEKSEISNEENMILFNCRKFGTPVPYLKLSNGILNEHLTFQMSRVMALKTSNPKIFKILFPLIHHVCQSVQLPLWCDNVLWTAKGEMEMEMEMELDEQDEEDSKDNTHASALALSIDEYTDGEPSVVAARLASVPEISLVDIVALASKCNNEQLNRIVSLGEYLVSSGLRLADFTAHADYDESLPISDVVYIAWDYNSAVEDVYHQYLDRQGNELGLQLSTLQMEVADLDSMKQRVCDSFTFLNALRSFMISVSSYLG